MFYNHFVLNTFNNFNKFALHTNIKFLNILECHKIKINYNYRRGPS